jgi:hypothetical protein
MRNRRRAMNVPMFDLELHDGDQVEEFPWVTMACARFMIENMRKGADLVVRRTDEDATEGSEYA